jgi:hypothetical protein
MRSEALVDAFWTRFVNRAGDYPRGARKLARSLAQIAPPLPETFVTLVTRGAVGGVHAPELRAGAVGDWLVHALERHDVLRALADTYGNPALAHLVPFGEAAGGLEVALDLARGAVVLLDPSRYDSPGEGVAAVVAEGVESFLRAQLAAADAPDVAAR